MTELQEKLIKELDEVMDTLGNQFLTRHCNKKYNRGKLLWRNYVTDMKVRTQQTDVLPGTPPHHVLLTTVTLKLEGTSEELLALTKAKGSDFTALLDAMQLGVENNYHIWTDNHTVLYILFTRTWAITEE